MDEFKKYLFEHRDELDVEKAPRPQVWNHIKQQTVAPAETRKGERRLFTTAKVITVGKWLAAAVIAAVAILLVYRTQLTEKDPNPAGTVQSGQSTTNTNQQQAVNTHSDGRPELISQADSLTGFARIHSNENNNSKELPGTEDSSNKTFITPVKEKIKHHTKNHPDQGYQLAQGMQNTSATIASAKRAAKIKKTVSPLKAMEDNYAFIINYQVKKLERTPIYAEDANYFHVFKKQWYDLEKDEKKVRHDAQLYGLNDKIVDQLIQLYQQKLWLLQELQTEITKMNIRAHQYPELEKPSPTYFKLHKEL
jgi:hypothetical protein